MGSQQALCDVTSSLNSVKKKDKFEAIEHLTELLNQEDVVQNLKCSTSSPEAIISCDVVFTRVHNAAVSLIDDNFSKNRQMSDKNAQILQNIILLVIQRSLDQKVLLINSNLLVSSTLEVFATQFRCRVLGCTYLNILYKYVMAERRNWGQLKKDCWIGLKNLCKDSIKRHHTGTQSMMYLEILCDVIKNSTKNCQTTTSFIDLFEFVKELFINYKELGTNYEICLLRLTNILCLQLAIEFRYKVCEFTEDIFDFVIGFYKKKNSDINILVKDFLTTCLSVHNPNGAPESEKSAYASNLNKWKSKIYKIYVLCTNRIKEVLRNLSNVEAEIDILDLFVDASHLVFVYGMDISEDFGDFDEPQPLKKRKYSIDGFSVSLGSSNSGKLKLPKIDTNYKNLVTHLQTHDGWFWLKFLELVLFKYPNDLKCEYKALINVLYQIFCDKKDFMIIKTTLRCLNHIINSEKKLQLSDADIKDFSEIWNKISKDLIRCLHIETCSEAHSLLRALISHSKLHDPRPLIKLYCTGTLPTSVENFKTLYMLCHNCILPDVISDDDNSKLGHSCYENVKENLLSWLINGEVKYPCKEFAKLLIVIASKKFEESSVKRVEKENILITHTGINDFCNLITNNYKITAFELVKFVEISTSTNNKTVIRFDFKMRTTLIDLLKGRCQQFIDRLTIKGHNYDQQITTLENCYWFCELLCHLLSTAQFMNCSLEDSCLMENFELLFHMCTSKSLEILQKQFFDLTCLSNIYKANFHHNIQKIIRSSSHINLGLLQLLFQIFRKFKNGNTNGISIQPQMSIKSNSEFSNLIKSPKSAFHFQALTENEKAIVMVTELLCQYIRGPSFKDSSHYQSTLATKIIDTLLLETDSFQKCSIFFLQLVLRSVYAFTKYDTISVSVLNNCLSLIFNVLSKTSHEPEINLTILQVLKDILPLINKNGDSESHQKCMKLMEHFKSLILIKKCCGVKTASKFIECLVELFKCDPDGKWVVLERNGERYNVFEDILLFYKHTSYEVRLTAALHIGELFIRSKSCNDNITSWQKNMLKFIFNELNDCESLYPKEKGCILEYVINVTTSVSLLSWASIICKSSFWRKTALFYLFHLACVNQYKHSEVNDILKLIFGELCIVNHTDYFKYNFMYLFCKWIRRGHHVQDFPYYILGCRTLEEFIKTFFRPIVTVYARQCQFVMIDSIATTMKKPVAQILKECYPRVMSFVLPTVNKPTHSFATNEIFTLKNFLEERLPSEMQLEFILKNLEKIIFHLVKNMHDPVYLGRICPFSGNIEDDESPFGFTGPQIAEILKNLGNEVLKNMVLNCPSKVERILTLLMENMEQSITYEDKIFAFYKYIFFVEIIGETTKKGRVFEVVNTYIIRDVIYSLIAIIRKDEGQLLTDMACRCLKTLAEFYLPEFNKIFGQFLPALTSVLTSLISCSNEKALDVLHFLVCQNYSKLEENIVLLDVFPANEMFKEINQKIRENQVNVASNLKSILQHFVNANKNSGYRIESLKYLSKSLSERKDELKEMYQNLTRVRGFSEDCKKSLLHQLICVLVELTGNKNSEVKMEAAKCLGELGASDLTTLVLRPENNFLSSELSDSAINNLLKISLSRLSDLLICDNFIVKKYSLKALYAILSVQQGKDVIRCHNDTCKNFEYILLFEAEEAEDLRLKIRKDIFLSNMNQTSIWTSDSHEKWITNFVDELLQSLSDSSGIITSIRELSHTNWKFAEDILPFILDIILSSGDKDCAKIINRNFNTFFEKHFNFKNKTQPSVNKQSVQCMLNVVDYIRKRRHLEGIFEEGLIDVNYINLAKAALHCSAYFTSIFYLELWSEQKRRGNYSFIDVNTICELFPEEGFALTEILRECHSEIGNSDGIHGCGYMHILETAAEIQHYEHVKNWNMSLLHHDIQLSMGNEENENGLIRSLKSSGMYYSLNSMLKMKRDSVILTPLQYKCATQLSDWSLLDTTFKTNITDYSDNDCFDKCYYFALKAFLADDDATFQNDIRRARQTVLNKLLNCNLESTKNLYLPISELQTLKELEEFVGSVHSLNKQNLWNLFHRWKKQDSIRFSDFGLMESIWSNRTIFIKIALDKMEKCDIYNDLQLMLCQTYCNIIETAREEKKYETAIRMLNYMNNLNRTPKEIVEKLKIERARILWERGEHEIGRFLLNHYVRKNEITGELKAKGLRIYGDWMAKTKSENSREIIQNYYLKSIVQSNDAIHLTDCYASIAKFADSNYEQLNEYLASPLFEIKQNLINTQQDLALELRQELGWNQNREKRMAYQIAAKQSAIDENEIKNSKIERDSFLNLALKYYLLSLKEGEKYNLFVFRITSLWLSNSSNQDVIQHLKKLLPQIPTYKFLCLLPQLIPRMADVCLISDLVERILLDHPHHTLPLLFALSNSYEDLKYSGGSTNFSTPRVQAAKSILDKFQNDKKLGNLIVEMNNFTKALIELANYCPPEKGAPGRSFNFPSHLKIKQLKNLINVPVPSLNVPFDKNCSYNSLIGVHGFQENFDLVGGVNLPKRITCIGSDGIGRSLLVKGKDDLRQDAVMQQVFTIMNSLLSQNLETKKRKLIIRTYRVVPLSQRSGIIEWCENTQPLSLYLTGQDGKAGAHKKFYPDDLSPFECRCMLRNVFAQPGVTNQDKLNVFLDICKRFHPVFHYFFIEKFPAAGVWFERRLAYIHSVATSSMIGYILGIGDRHVHNILIDNSTAEVIHIDLGIAFEQGKTLPIPETVPFRLSRDIVDGMGLSVIEGDFRISCIKTMEVLREHQDTILTLLEVLLYDPLYTWTITPEKAYSMQGQTETGSSTTEKSSPDMETNKMAERALIRLKQKLQGTETGCVATTVEGQISYLVQQARDPNNLCRLFHGWQAYL